MTKEREALKLALEALENNRQTHHYCEDTWYSCPKHEDGCANESEGDECNCGADKANAEIDKAITAIKEALAQPEPYDQTALELCDKCGWKTVIPNDCCLNCERKAQPEQDSYYGYKGKCNRVMSDGNPCGLNAPCPDCGLSLIDCPQPQPWEKFCDSNCVWTDHHPDCKLAEPEQEPVAFSCLRCVTPKKCAIHGCSPNTWPSEDPPQRKPLSYEDLIECEQLAGIRHRIHMGSIRGQQLSPADEFLWHYARAIEAAHNIKGEA